MVISEWGNKSQGKWEKFENACPTSSLSTDQVHFKKLGIVLLHKFTV